MNTLREAAQQALKALAGYRRHIGDTQPCDAEIALRAALAQGQTEPPTNQCGETCERAKLCAACARALEEPTGKQDLQVDHGLSMNTPQAAQRLLEALAAALPHAPHRAEFDIVADAADDLRKALEREDDQTQELELAASLRYPGGIDDPMLSAALGYPGGISDPLLNRVELLRMVAKMRVEQSEEEPIGFIPRDQYDFLLRGTHGVNTRIELARQYPFVVPIYVKPQ